MEVNRIFDLLDKYLNQFPDKQDVFGGKKDGAWIKYSTNDYIEHSHNICYGFLNLGIKNGDKIATISNNRPEWNFIDMGIMLSGAIQVPIYPSINSEDYKYIFKDAEIKYLIVSTKDLIKKLQPIINECPSIIEVFTIDEIENYKSWKYILDLGKNNQQLEKLKQIKQNIQPKDVATIIYSSGTTGFPKGVMLSHENLVSNFIAVSPIPRVTPETKALSYLPLCHVYERMMNYMYQYLGISIYYTENLATIVDNLKELKPHILTSVPRLLEKIYDKLYSTGKKLPYLKRKLFFWALHVARRYELNGENGWFYELKLKIADKLVYCKWREALGGNLEIIVSGGAALQPRLSKFFWAVKIPIIEGYGLSETSPVIAVGNLEPNGVKFGTVGPILTGVEVKIAEDGEILCRGKNVMLGYFNQPQLTKEAIDEEGWFHTGDIGEFVENRFLKITDRKKEMFKTSMGKYISPLCIENKFKESAFIENIMVVGENEKFAAALIVPSFSFIQSWVQTHGVQYKSNEQIIEEPIVIDRYKKEIIKYNKFLGQPEQIKNFKLLPTDWTTETGELTPTLKLKRKFVAQKFENEIKELYS